MMDPAAPPVALLRLLEEDRVWSAYALADLDPEAEPPASWILHGRAAAILFPGLAPPWLSIHGDPNEIPALQASIPSGAVQYALLGTHRTRLERLEVHSETRMWRMVLRPQGELPPWPPAAERLGPGDLSDLLDLFDEHPDRPDGFDRRQLAGGVFYGIRAGPRLVAVAGTHAIGRSTSVAAVGNVFTHPAHRRRGYGRRTSGAVVRALRAEGIATIVLNVAMANEGALELYRALGFWPFCGYYEGFGELTADPRR